MLCEEEVNEMANNEYSIKVVVDDKIGAERSLKKFKRLCESYGVIREYRKRQEYKKPSIRNKEKLAAAEKRRKKTQTKFYRGSKI